MDELELDVDTAIPLGLIANELVTNSLKYAFPLDRHSHSDGGADRPNRSESGESQENIIEISLTPAPNHQLCLRVTDNGVGTTSEVSPQGTGFGSRLVQLLAIQLNGHVEQETGQGMATIVRFTPLASAA